MKNSSKSVASFLIRFASNKDRRLSLKKLGVENLEERSLLSASTLLDVATIASLASNAADVAAQEVFTPIDLSNAVFDSANPIVTSTADDGSEGTLRYAIENADSGAHITFDSSLQDQTITLGGSDILINKDVWIDGANSNITIDANQQSRVFTIVGAPTVDIYGVTLAGGREDLGGAIYVATQYVPLTPSVDSVYNPGNPDDPTDPTNPSITVSWTPVDDVDDYKVYVSVDGADPVEVPVGEDGTSATLENVTPGSNYEFTVVAENEAGDSTPATTSSKPIAATASENDGVITVDLQPQGATATYEWSYVDENGDTVVIDGADGPTYTRTDETAGRTVTVNVTGTGESENSEATVTVVPEAPNAPENLVANYDAANTAITVTWDPDPAALEYTVTYTATDGSTGSFTITDGSTNVTVPNPTPGETYTFSVVASNEGGDSPASTVDCLVTEAPSAPENLVAAYDFDADAITVTWDPDPAALEYTVTYTATDGSTGSFTITDGSTNVTVPNPTPGETYTFSVVASNEGGNSPASTVDCVVPQAPNAPENLVANYDADNNAITVEWDPDPAALEYTVTYTATDGSTGSFTITDGSTNVTVPNPTPGETYTFSVVASNEGGNSPASTVDCVVPQAPNAPENLVANYDADNNAITVEWDPDPAALEYTVTYTATDGSTGSFTITDGSTSVTVPNPTLGETYTFSVVASNEAGDSPASTVDCTPERATETPSLVVTTESDVVDDSDGVVSLREALAYGKADPSLGDTITFDASKIDGDIQMNEPFVIDYSINVGDGSVSVTVDGGTVGEIFDVTNGAVVTMDGVSLKRGYGKNVNGTVSGGAIVVEGGANLTFKNADITESQATNGGAIYVESGAKATIASAKLTGSNATNGGAVYAKGEVELRNVLVSGSRSNGAVYGAAGSKTTFRNVTVAGNTARNYSAFSALVFAQNSELHMFNSLVVSNGSGQTVKFNSINGESRNTAFKGMDQRNNSGYFGSGGTFKNNITGFNSDWYLNGNESNILNSDYTLNKESLSWAANLFIDAGEDDYVTADMTEDLAGNPRKVKYLYDSQYANRDKVDLGAYELKRDIPSGYVTVANDSLDPYDGEVSIREAIYYLSSNSENLPTGYQGTYAADYVQANGNVVTFDGALAGSTITLGDDGAIKVSTSMTIDGGHGDKRVTIDAGGSSFAFNADKDLYGDKNPINVTLESLNIVNAHSSEAAVRFYSRGGSLTVSNCNFENNVNTSAYNGGGALYVAEGQAIVTDTVFKNNEALKGGAVWVQNQSASLTATQVLFENNTARDSGGALYCENNETFTLNSVTFSGNTATNDGGAIYATSGSILGLTDVTASGNTAKNGGFAYIYNSATTVNSSTVTNNSATQRGGAFYVADNGPARLYINGVTFSGNSAGISGNDIYKGAAGTVTGASFSTSLLDASAVRFTEALEPESAAITVSNALAATHATLNLENVTIESSEATQNGAAIYARDAMVQGINLVLHRNESGNGDEGVLYLDGSSEASITSALIAQNVSGIILKNDSRATIVNATIAGNNAVAGQTDAPVAIRGDQGAYVTLYNTIVYENDVDVAFTAYNSVLNKDYGISDANQNVVYTVDDVLFVEGGYDLADDSIAVNLGVNDYVEGIVETDVKGQTRIVDGTVDAGAIENQRAKETPSIIVTTYSDDVDPYDNKISLREAIEVYFAYETRTFNADVDPSGKTVTFDLPEIFAIQLYNGTITISDSMSIYGDVGEGENATLDAQYTARIFKVADGVESVAFEKLDFYHGATMQLDSVQPGSAYDETQEALNGGAIYAGDANITVKDSLFNANWGYIGGAIFVNGGTLAVDGATFEDNLSVYQGGAIAVYASAADDEALTIENSAFAGNKSDRAGAVYFKNGEATISNTTFDENEARFANGGAITVANSTVSLADVELTDNAAERFGGAIFAGTSNVAINNGENVAISGNEAQYGGAIYNSKGNLNVVSGVFTENSAAVSGGAIYSGTQATIAAVFTNNEAGEDGGAIYAGGSLSVDDSTFSENAATAAGGAVYATKGAVTITGSTFEKNESTTGGGAIRFAKSTTATIEDTTFSENNAGGVGGAIAASATTSLTINGGEFSGNGAQNSGGAVYATSVATFASVGANYVGNTTEKFGGALAIAGATLTVTEGEFRENEANSGGAIYVTTGAVEVNSATISGNTATSYGAGVYAVESDVKATDTTISGNTATTAGGAIFAAQGGKVTVELSTVSGNKATNGAGGAIYASSADAVVVSGSSITTNTASGSGGAIFAHKTDVFVEALNGVGATLTKNESGKFGGAVYAVDGSGYVGYHFFDGVDFAENTAVAGGAIYGSNSSFKVSDVDFDENAATERGGAIFITAGESVAVESSNFSGNTATQAGGALYLDKSESTVKDSTFEGNGAQNGGALEQVSGTLAVEDSYFEKNVAQGVGGAIYQLHGTSTLSKVEFAENEATTKAGAVYVGAGASTISGSTFSGNVASRGTAIAALNATSLEIDGEAFPASGAIEEGDLSSAILDEAFAELFFEDLD